jgi:hypothetical protein
MWITTAPQSSTPRALQQASWPAAIGPDSSVAAHDPTLLLAALEEIEARRAAIEWLLEADLLRLILI